MKKKLLSALAAAAMLTSVAAFPVSAADENAVSAAQALLAEEAASLDAVAVAQAREMLATALASDDTFYYPAYTTYSTSNVSAQQHYMAAIPVANATMPASAFGVEFYLNVNITSAQSVVLSDFAVGSGYQNCVTLPSVTTTTSTASSKKVTLRCSPSGSAPAGDTELFTYKFAETSSLPVNSEYDFHVYTSQYPTAPSVNLYTNGINSYTLRKCVYSLADVDRDGDVDGDDASGIMCCVVRLADVDPDRSAEDGRFDKIACELAADCNEDGVIDILDVVTANRIVNAS